MLRTKILLNSKNQSQKHGFLFENEIRSKVFKLDTVSNDTKKYDIDCKENIYNPNENISIKTTGSNNIDCGDILRFFNRDIDIKTTMIIGFYRQVNQYIKQIIDIVEVDYNDKLHRILFGDITLDEISKYVASVKSIPIGKVTNKDYIAVKNDLQKKYNMYIRISPKVDSKNQRRVQCSIPKIQELLKMYPELIINRTIDGVLIVRGIQIDGKISSQRRKRQ